MENNQPHQELFEKINNFITSEIDDLIQNKNNQAQGILMFHELKPGLEEFQNILSYAKPEIILSLPEFKIAELKQKLNPLFERIEAIQNFKKNTEQSDKQQKYKIIQFFNRPFIKDRPNESGYFAREKDDIWQIIIQAIALYNNNRKHDNEAKAIIQRLQEIEKNAISHDKKLKEVLESAQTELSKTGVEKHSDIFQYQADIHKAESFRWRKYSIILFISTILAAVIFFYIIAFEVEEIKKIIETSILAALMISMLTYMLTLTVKNYFAEKHNESINRHKANCLSTFNTFVDSADEERKATILLQATQTIFSHQSSGFLSKENDIQNPNPIIELVRNVANKQNPI